jgi:hypothetical protein
MDTKLDVARTDEMVKAHEKRTAQHDAIKLLNDWSKWLVTIEVTALGVVGSITLLGHVNLEPVWSHRVVIAFTTITTIGSLAFAVSIYYACLLLISLPDVLQQVYAIGECCFETKETTRRYFFRVVSVLIPWKRWGDTSPMPKTTHQESEDRNIFYMWDRDVKIPLHLLLNGQYWFFIAGLYSFLICLVSLMFFRSY